MRPDVHPFLKMRITPKVHKNMVDEKTVFICTLLFVAVPGSKLA